MASILSVLPTLLWSLGVMLVLVVIKTIVFYAKMLIPRQFRYKDVGGQVVLVTGGGSGIGRLICCKMAKLGCRIVTWDISKEGNDETVKLVEKAGGRAYSYTVNVGDRNDVYKMAAQVKEEVGKIDILINNAGVVSGSSFLDIPDHLVEKTFNVNILSHFWTIKAFLPDMLAAKQGHIVNVSSAAGLTGLNRLSDYCASKFAAVGLHESITMEFRVADQDYIKSTLVCPFFINTGMFDGAASPYIPILEPDYVASEIVEAIRLNVEYLVLPWSLKPLLFLRHLMPACCFAIINSKLGGDNSMAKFVGRKKEN